MGNLRRSMEAESCLQDVEIDRGLLLGWSLPLVTAS